MLLHGFPQTRCCWERVGPGLAAAGCRVLSLVQRGYSPRARPAGYRSYGLDRLAGDALAVRDALGAERLHLVGHDFGGIVGWYLAGCRPEALTTLTSIS